MARRNVGSVSLALGLALLLAPTLIGPLSRSYIHTSAIAPAATAQHATIQSTYGQMPLSFELNEGQAVSSARFLAHGSGLSLALMPDESLLALSRGVAAYPPRSRFTPPGQPKEPELAAPSSILGMQWLGANSNPVVTGEQPLPGKVNYFIGNDPAKWRTNIPTYQQVRYHNIYPGIDLIYYGNQGQLEYDFVVAPGANPARIALGFTGTRQVGVDLLGNLSLALPGGALQQAKPLIYQAVNGARRTVAGGYALTGSGRVGFALGAYNRSLPLVIDPAYKFSTYLGGSGGDSGAGIAEDAGGNIYVTGSTVSTNFPTTAGVPQTTLHNSYDNVFVSKLNANGTALVYSTYLGGSGNSSTGAGDDGNGIAVDSGGNAYIAGFTVSTNFPTTAGAFQTSLAGSGDDNAFVTKLNTTGSALVYSTYLGGSGSGGLCGCAAEYATGIAVDAGGDAYVTGSTASDTFPITPGAFQTSNAGSDNVFVTKFNASGTALVYSTYLGGSGGVVIGPSVPGDYGYGIAVDSSGEAYVTGQTYSTNFPTTPAAFQTTNAGYPDAFVTKFNASGSGLVYSTYLGGSGSNEGFGIAVDSSGSAYATGMTSSSNFPTTPGAFQSSLGSAQGNAFVSKLNASGTALAYSSYLGGNDSANGGYFNDTGYGIAVDATGDAVLTGRTYSTNFPLVTPLQNTFLSTSSGGDGFVSKVNASGTALLFSTYLGGSGNGSNTYLGDGGAAIAAGVGGTVYVTGSTNSTDFPTANALYPTARGNGDAFVTKLLTLPSVDTTTGVFRPGNGVLYLKNSNSTGFADITLNYGLPGDLPLTGDWTGKGYKSIGIYRNGTFYLRNSNTTGYADIVVPFGASGDLPVAGDWTGKGYDSIGYYQPSTSTFYLRDSNSPGPADHIVTLGLSGDVPIVGDWTNKGYDSVGVFRPSNGNVYLRNSNTTGYADIVFDYGLAGDQPVVGDWDSNGTDTIGIDRNGVFYLRNSNSTGNADIVFALGIPGDDPIAGPWLAPASSPPPVHRGSSGGSAPTHTPTTHARASAVTPRGRYAIP